MEWGVVGEVVYFEEIYLGRQFQVDCLSRQFLYRWILRGAVHLGKGCLDRLVIDEYVVWLGNSFSGMLFGLIISLWKVVWVSNLFRVSYSGK